MTKRSKKGTVQWNERCEQAFTSMKHLIAKETLLAYPDFNKKFASDFQLGTVIMQENKPLAFISRKLTSAQRNYTTTEKELLSIVKTLKEFRNILLGYKIKVFTDHKTLTYESTECSLQRAQRWRGIIQEFDIEFKFITGKANKVADAISRLPKKEHERADRA